MIFITDERKILPERLVLLPFKNYGSTVKKRLHLQKHVRKNHDELHQNSFHRMCPIRF